MKHKTKFFLGFVWHSTSAQVKLNSKKNSDSNDMNSVLCFLLFSECHVDGYCCNYYILLSRSKPSVNEHMIQICHLGSVFLLSLPCSEMFKCYHLDRIWHDLCFVSHACHGTNFYGFFFSHLDTHLLLIKLKLDGNNCWLFWYMVSGTKA